MPEELCQVSPKSHYVSLALHSDPSPYIINQIVQLLKLQTPPFRRRRKKLIIQNVCDPPNTLTESILRTGTNSKAEVRSNLRRLASPAPSNTTMWGMARLTPSLSALDVSSLRFLMSERTTLVNEDGVRVGLESLGAVRHRLFPRPQRRRQSHNWAGHHLCSREGNIIRSDSIICTLPPHLLGRGRSGRDNSSLCRRMFWGEIISAALCYTW